MTTEFERRITFLDLSREARRLKQELRSAFEEVVDSGVFLFGPKTEMLEVELACRTTARHAVAVSSGRRRLRSCCARTASDAVTGHHMAASFYSSAKAIAAAGATVRFADVDPESYNLDAECAAAQITPRTRAILVVHLSTDGRRGSRSSTLADTCRPAPAGGCRSGARRQRRGSAGWKLGQRRRTLSFYPTKNVGALGDAGALLTW